jgi:hypothetical protein
MDQRISGLVHNRLFPYQPCNYRAAGKAGMYCKGQWQGGLLNSDSVLGTCTVNPEDCGKVGRFAFAFTGLKVPGECMFISTLESHKLGLNSSPTERPIRNRHNPPKPPKPPARQALLLQRHSRGRRVGGHLLQRPQGAGGALLRRQQRVRQVPGRAGHRSGEAKLLRQRVARLLTAGLSLLYFIAFHSAGTGFRCRNLHQNACAVIIH